MRRGGELDNLSPSVGVVILNCLGSAPKTFEEMVRSNSFRSRIIADVKVFSAPFDFGDFLHKHSSRHRCSPSNGLEIKAAADSTRRPNGNENPLNINALKTGSIRSFIETVSQ